MLFLLPGKLFAQLNTWLSSSVPSGLFPAVTLAERLSLTTPCKIQPPTLQLEPYLLYLLHNRYSLDIHICVGFVVMVFSH